MIMITTSSVVLYVFNNYNNSFILTTVLLIMVLFNIIGIIFQVLEKRQLNRELNGIIIIPSSFMIIRGFFSICIELVTSVIFVISLGFLTNKSLNYNNNLYEHSVNWGVLALMIISYYIAPFALSLLGQLLFKNNFKLDEKYLINQINQSETQ